MAFRAGVLAADPSAWRDPLDHCEDVRALVEGWRCCSWHSGADPARLATGKATRSRHGRRSAGGWCNPCGVMVELGKGWTPNPTHRRLERGRAKAGSISALVELLILALQESDSRHTGYPTRAVITSGAEQATRRGGWQQTCRESLERITQHHPPRAVLTGQRHPTRCLLI